VEYRSSALTHGDAALGGLRPGDRFPDISLRDCGGPVRLFEVLRAGHHVLVMSAESPEKVDGLYRFRDTFDVVVGDIPAGRVVLIRPDGYIAATGKPDDLEPIDEYLSQVFPEPTNSPSPSLRKTLAPLPA
jgi:hypothetical protein